MRTIRSEKRVKPHRLWSGAYDPRPGDHVRMAGHVSSDPGTRNRVKCKGVGYVHETTGAWGRSKVEWPDGEVWNICTYDLDPVWGEDSGGDDATRGCCCRRCAV